MTKKGGMRATLGEDCPQGLKDKVQRKQAKGQSERKERIK